MHFTIAKKRPLRVYPDAETTGLLRWCGDVPFSFGHLIGGTKTQDFRYFEWKVDPFTRKCVYDSDDIKIMQDLWEDERITKIFFNAPFDIGMGEVAGVKCKGRIEDVFFAAKICNQLELSYGLKHLAQWHCDYPRSDEEKLQRIVVRLRNLAKKLGWKIADDVKADYWLCGHAPELMKGASQAELDEIQSLVGIYCCGDVYRGALLWERKYCRLLDSDEHFRNIYEQEISDMPIYLGMEARGAHLSKKRVETGLKHAKDIRDHQLADLQKQITLQRKRAGLPALNDFNPGSPAQMAKVVYGAIEDGGFGLECKVWTDSGQDSVKYAAIREYLDHPFIRSYLRYGAYDKGLEFFEKYRSLMQPDKIVPGSDDFVIHCKLNQVIPVTGRLSSQDPNLQNVPKESSMKEEHSEARSPFGPRRGYNWFSIDYAQMELRVFADEAQVAYLLDAIKENRDLNTENANRIFGGKDNRYALERASSALNLGAKRPENEKVQTVWNELGWNPDDYVYGAHSNIAMEFADKWLSHFEYQIVAAEKSIGLKSTRDLTKIATFCMLYGGGIDALMDVLRSSKAYAVDIKRAYDQQCPEIGEYQDRVSRQAARDGYIITRYGRKILVDHRSSYKAIDYTIQGPCADLMKSAIRRTHQLLKSTKLDAHLVLTIHDELILEILKQHSFPWLLKDVMSIMSDHEGRLGVPMPVEISIIRERWDKKEELHLL